MAKGPFMVQHQIYQYKLPHYRPPVPETPK